MLVSAAVRAALIVVVVRGVARVSILSVGWGTEQRALGGHLYSRHSLNSICLVLFSR